MIQDLGFGVGTFLKCPSFQIDEQTPGSLLKNDMIVQIGANLYCLVNIITRQQYNEFNDDDSAARSSGVKSEGSG